MCRGARCKTLALAAVLALQVSLALPARADTLESKATTVQSRASYEAAFRVLSTSPSYVLITVIDARTGQAHPVCTTSNFLLGAIHREHALGYDAADSAKGVEIALEAQDHVFRFQRQASLDNIPMRYSEAELQAARDFLAPLSTEELKDKFSSLYANRRLDTTGYAKDAIACVLIERGLSPAMADISGQVYVPR
jgi:hypothetical protein